MSYKPCSEQTLLKMTKKELVEHIRMLEENWSNEKETTTLLQSRLSRSFDYIEELVGDTKMMCFINKMMKEDNENKRPKNVD